MRKFYVKYNQFGTNFTPNSIGWEILIFGSRKERDAWLDENYHDGNNRVATAVLAKNVNKYIRCNAGQVVIAEYDEGHGADKLVVRYKNYG